MANRKLNLDKDLLYNLYITKKKTLQECANMFNCCASSIKKYINLYGFSKDYYQGDQIYNFLDQKKIIYKKPLFSNKYNNFQCQYGHKFKATIDQVYHRKQPCLICAKYYDKIKKIERSRTKIPSQYLSLQKYAEENNLPIPHFNSNIEDGLDFYKEKSCYPSQQKVNLFFASFPNYLPYKDEIIQELIRVEKILYQKGKFIKPSIIAGAIIYKILNFDHHKGVSQEDISLTLNCSPSSIRNIINKYYTK